MVTDSFSLITWNIQWGRGCDGVVNLPRIVNTARALADFDVLCLQEVASNYSALDGSAGEDQPALLAGLLPDYTPLFAAATDVNAEHDAPANATSASRGASPGEIPTPRRDRSRRLFGNMILSRLPVVQVFRHLLPWPVDPDVPSMQRVLIEAIVDTCLGPLRVMTTHLEYYSARQRAAQVERIRDLHAEAAMRARLERTREDTAGPFRAVRRAASLILTGDFNFRPDDALHARMCAPCGDGVPSLRDAWQVHHPGVPHPPSLGLFDRSQWPDGGYCCDFIFVSEDLCPRISGVRVDQHSDASDHQPTVLTLGAGLR
jgi:endonuclease/exonuclease/phosphatase family metal-dependent hydrolase